MNLQCDSWQILMLCNSWHLLITESELFCFQSFKLLTYMFAFTISGSSFLLRWMLVGKTLYSYLLDHLFLHFFAVKKSFFSLFLLVWGTAVWFLVEEHSMFLCFFPWPDLWDVDLFPVRLPVMSWYLLWKTIFCNQKITKANCKQRKNLQKH